MRVSHSWKSAGAVLLLCAGIPAAHAQANYTYTFLNVPGSTSTSAVAINNSGEVAGGYNNGSQGAYLYNGSSYTTFSVPGSSGTFFSGLNNNGVAAGGYTFGTVYNYNCGLNCGGSFTQDYGFTVSGGRYSLFDPVGAVTDFVNAINDSGIVVGQYATAATAAAGSLFLGYRYNAGAFSTIDPPGSSFSAAFGVNSSGQIVGNSDFGGFLYSGGLYTILNPPGSVAGSSSANAINDNGVVVGGYETASHAFSGYIYNSGSYTTFAVPGATQTRPLYINASGQIVGEYIDAAGTRHGFIYSGGIYTTLDPAGATFTAITGINAIGQIVGFYRTAAAPQVPGTPNIGFIATNGLIENLPAGGTPSTPVAFSGQGIGQITGSIGGLGSTAFYEFDWGGGDFSANASVTGADAAGSYLFELLNLNGQILEQMTLDAGDFFDSLISDAGLSEGDYEIGLIADSAFDPSFTITFNTPVNGTAVPEPGSLAVFGGAGAAIWLTQRRKRRRIGLRVQAGNLAPRRSISLR